MTRGNRSARAFAPRRLLRSILMGVACCGASAMAGTGNGDLTDTNINYVGRWDKGNSAT